MMGELAEQILLVDQRVKDYRWKNHKFVKRTLAVEELHQRHEVIIAIKPNNLDKLKQVLKEVSDSKHENYGKYFTRDQIAELTRNEEGNKIVKEYLTSLNLSIQQESEYGDFLTVIAPLSSWQTHLKTNFFEFRHDSLGTVYRAESPYELPDHVHQHVVDLFNINDLPVEVFGSPIKYPFDQVPSRSASKNDGDVSYGGGYITPESLYSYYQLKPSLGNNMTTQAAIETLGQILSTYDLNFFQEYYELPTHRLSRSVGKHVTASPCPSVNDCAEANLDFQYLMAVGRHVLTTSIYFEFRGWLPIIQNLTSWNNPPKVISISYGSDETYMPSSYLQTWNTLAMQLGVMGTTLVVASGDDGASGYYTRSTKVCTYGPMFPATSPYVLSVGGTMGPEIDAPEVLIVDVTLGNNSCTVVGYKCCPQGFPATTGWDAASGLGSLDFTALYHMAVPQNSPAGKPTANTSIADKSAATAGTIFFLVASLVLVVGYALTGIKQVVKDRRPSFIPINNIDDEVDCPL
eukprot:gene7736-8354_t